MNARLKSKQLDAQLEKLTATERTRIERGEFMVADENWQLCRDCYGSGEDRQGNRCPACGGKGEKLIKQEDAEQ